MGQILLKSGKHNAGARFCRYVTVRLLEIIRIYISEYDI